MLLLLLVALTISLTPNLAVELSSSLLKQTEKSEHEMK